jgi:hypothetical protein
MIEVKEHKPNIAVKASITETKVIRTTNGFINPEGTIQNIGILKNASTYFSYEAEKQGWTLRSIPFTEKITRFVILRDPYERYLSGLVEDFARYQLHNPEKQAFFKNLLEKNFFFDFFDFLFDSGAFEIADHTQLQTKILQFILDGNNGIKDIIFIKLTDQLGTNLNLFLQGENCQSRFTNEKLHSNNNNDDAQNFYHMVQYYFYDVRNSKRKQKLLEYLQPDYRLFNSVNFFNGI